MILKGYKKIAEWLEQEIGPVSPQTLPQWARRETDPLPVNSLNGRRVGRPVVGHSKELTAWAKRQLKK